MVIEGHSCPSHFASLCESGDGPLNTFQDWSALCCAHENTPGKLAISSLCVGQAGFSHVPAAVSAWFFFLQVFNGHLLYCSPPTSNHALFTCVTVQGRKWPVLSPKWLVPPPAMSSTTAKSQGSPTGRIGGSRALAHRPGRIPLQVTLEPKSRAMFRGISSCVQGRIFAFHVDLREAQTRRVVAICAGVSILGCILGHAPMLLLLTCSKSNFKTCSVCLPLQPGLPTFDRLGEAGPVHRRGC